LWKNAVNVVDRHSMTDFIDEDGFRANVGIILTNRERQVFWGGRAGRDGWQFPQGGVEPDEDPQDAMFRELGEEIGLTEADVRLVGSTRGWLRYRLPKRFIRNHSWPLCIGQKQRWFLLQMDCPENRLRFDTTSRPEFDRWRWVDYWHPVKEVIYFKRHVYRRALEELGPLAFPNGAPPCPRHRRRRRNR
jgi:putative (di)nucleoside polyphosphate hydrolase